MKKKTITGVVGLIILNMEVICGGVVLNLDRKLLAVNLISMIAENKMMKMKMLRRMLMKNKKLIKM
jgi:hypothetical protein